MKLSIIPREAVPAVWPHILSLVEKIASGHHGQKIRRSPENICAALVDGSEIGWVVLDKDDNAVALVLGAMLDFPLRRVMRIHSCVGDNRREWLHLLSEIEEFAKANGCADMEIICRKGWARDLIQYKLTHVVLVRPLNEVN